jgi:negative regulator of sigma E activity
MLMTEQINDQASAFVDDELSPEECAFFARRLERDEETRSKIMRYMATGAVLRKDLLLADGDLLRRRINASLDGVTMPRATKHRRSFGGFVKPLLGTGIAASVALAALVVLRGTDQLEPEVFAGDVAIQSLRASEPPSYVVPQEPRPGVSVTPPIRYTNYLMHHGEYASGLNRTLVRSNVVSTREVDLAVQGEDAFE